MYVHIIDNQSDDIINKQQCMQNIQVIVSEYRPHFGACVVPSILANAVGPAVIVYLL